MLLPILLDKSTNQEVVEERSKKWKSKMDEIELRSLRTQKHRSLNPDRDAQETDMCPAGSDTGLHGAAKQERSYERDGFTIECSRGKAIFFIFLGLILVICVALIIAFARPIYGIGKNGKYCPCSSKKPDNMEMDTYEKSNLLLSTSGEIFPWDNIRLPTFAHPFRYNISIHPNLTTSKIRGHITIELFVDENTKYIVFHSSGLTITEKMVQESRKGSKQKIARFLEYPDREQVYLELEGSFRKKMNYTVHLKYSSKLSNDLEGFYLSSYNTSKGTTRYVAATHFEPTFARTAFPCFDEPQFKARFKVSIYRDRFHIALCNMPIVNTEEAGFFLGTSILRDDFQESLEMSTYLVAFVVCDFKRTTSKTNPNLHVYAAEHMLSQASYATEIASEMMVYFEKFFGVLYPLPKQDLIAIPNFAAGAMENWGLITFREVAILHDPKETSIEAKISIAVTIAHELAHQWFGNLVTMKWWNDLWLNEGAASFFEFKAVNHFSPEWNVMDTFVIYKMQPALHFDALANSHPINVPVEDPNEIESIFDSISYNKGSAILYMLERFLGEDVFKTGLHDYLVSHELGNADTNDLWAAFTKRVENTYDVKAIMDTWTQQMGFPVIILSRKENVIRMTQSRFLISPKKNATNVLQPKSPFDYKWYIPVTYYTDKEPDTIQQVWLNMTHVDISETPPYDIKYIKCNVNQTGFYRVNYTDDMWTAIIQTLWNNHTKFSPADRANLIDDAFSLNEAGMLHAKIPLRLSLYLIKERDYIPWETAQNVLHSWRKRLSEDGAYKMFITYFKNLLRPVIKYVGWNDEGSHLKKLLRNSVIRSAIILGMDDVLKPVRNSFQQWITKSTPIPPNIRNVAYEIGIKYGDEKAWFYCWRHYLKTEISSEKQVLLQALSAATDSWLLQRYLLFSLDRKLIRTQDIGTVITTVAANENGRYLAWRHIKAYWPELVNLFGNGTYPLVELIANIVSNFYTEYDYREITEFFKQVNFGGGIRTLEQSLEMIKFNIYWVEYNGERVGEWLESEEYQRTFNNNPERTTETKRK